MNCRKVITDLSNYLDGELDADLKRAIEEHLKNCAHCHVILDTTQKTIELYCDGKLFSLPEDVHKRLHEAVARKWQEKAH